MTAERSSEVVIFHVLFHRVTRTLRNEPWQQNRESACNVFEFMLEKRKLLKHKQDVNLNPLCVQRDSAETLSPH